MLRHVWLNYEQGGPVFLRLKIFQGFATALFTIIVRPAKPMNYAPLTSTSLERYLTSHCFYYETEMFKYQQTGPIPGGIVLNTRSRVV